MIQKKHSKQSLETIPLVDMIRILAAWMVVTWHSSGFAGFRMPFFGSAGIAVDVFMNVSGFLMVFLFWERREKEPWNEPRTWLNFYIRRFFRISPLYYAALLFLVAVQLFAGLKIINTALPLWQWLLLRFSFLFGFSPVESANCIIPDWSLSLEMQFYACFPFLMLAMKRLGPGLFFFLCSSVGAAANFSIAHGFYDVGKTGLLGYYFKMPTLLPLKIQVFAVGMIVAMVLIRGPGELKSKWFWAAFPVYLLTCKEYYVSLLAALYWAAYVACCVRQLRGRFFNSLQTVDQKLKKMPLRQALADCSYGTYIIHNIVIVLVLDRIWPPLALGQGSLWHFASYLALTLGLTTMISWLFHKWIEKPGINLGRTIIRKFAD
jgi:peptidoglycan/LPS O-acetylase OafA/YrhL